MGSNMPGAQIDREDLLDELRALDDELDRTPRVRDVRREVPYNHETYRRRFGGHTDALKAAGITPDPSTADKGPHPIEEEALVTDLRRLGDELGRTPTIEDVQRDGRYSHGSYYNHFASFQTALEAADFEPNVPIQRQDLIDALHDLADDLGEPPTSSQMRNHGRYSPKPYRREFGGWVEALNAAGLNE